jgi:hypothetical protein
MKIRRYQFDEDGFMRLQKDIDALINNRNLDHQHIGRLYTEYCDIRSENGETIIEGPTLKMYDRQAVPVKRLQMGYNSADADFNLTIYDAAGNPTIYLNSTGEAVYAGNVITGKNAYVGDDLYLGSTATGTQTKAIRMRTATKDIVIRGAEVAGKYNIGIGLLNTNEASTEGMDNMGGTLFLYGSMNLLTGGTTDGNLEIGGKFACNGASPQASYSVNSAAAEDLTEVTALVNQLRTALINNGICA